MMAKNKKTNKVLSWIFGGILLVIGLLNIIFVHLVPGIVYILISLLFFPPINDIIKQKLGFAIPFMVKLILFTLIMWVTLGVGDLFELFESWTLRRM